MLTRRVTNAGFIVDLLKPKSLLPTLKNRRRHNFLAAAFSGVLALATTGARAYPAFGVTIKANKLTQ
jgi:hypothetical protein